MKKSIYLLILICASFAACNKDKDKVTPNLPFSVTITQPDTIASVNNAESFNLVLAFTGSSEDLTLNVSGQQGTIKIGSLTYSPGVKIPVGNYVVTYTPTLAGKQTLVFSFTNSAGTTHEGKAYYNVLSYTPVPFTISVTPSSFIDKNYNPGTQQNIDINVNSTDTGSLKYFLSWTSDGGLSVFYNSTISISQNSEINKGSNNLRLNIPPGLPTGNYYLALKVTDGNGDFKRDTIFVKVGP